MSKQLIFVWEVAFLTSSRSAYVQHKNDALSYLYHRAVDAIENLTKQQQKESKGAKNKKK